MSEAEEFEKIQLTVAILEYLKESAIHPMDFNCLWLERLGLTGMNSAEQKYDERVATDKGRRYLAWLEEQHG